MEFLHKKTARVAVRTSCDLFWCARADKTASGSTTLRTEIDDVVCHLDDIEVMLDDEDGVAALYKGVETLKQAADVMEMKTCGGFVEDEKCGNLFLHTYIIGKLHALVLATGEGG